MEVIFPPKTGGQGWTMNNIKPKERRFNPKTTITKNKDGVPSWKCKATKVRMNHFVDPFNEGDDFITDIDKLTEREYMQYPYDYKNFVMSGYVKLNKGSGDNFAWYGRGRYHTDDPCQGTAYKIDLYNDGHIEFVKELYHKGGEGYANKRYKGKTVGSINNKWIGFAGVFRNIIDPATNKTSAIQLDAYVNDPSRTTLWTNVGSCVDDGGWGNQGGQCGGDKDYKIIWGGPIVTFRWDTFKDVDFKDFQVYEIDPIKPFAVQLLIVLGKINNIKIKPDESLAEEMEIEFTSTCRSMVHSFFNQEWKKSRYSLNELRGLLEQFEAALDNLEVQFNKKP